MHGEEQMRPAKAGWSEMFRLKKLRNLKTWQILLITVILAELVTFVLSKLLLAFWGHEGSHRIYAVGIIDSFVASFLIGGLIIYFFNELRKVEASATEDLAMSENRYRAVVETQSELVNRFLADGTLTFVNEAFCRYYGVSREEIIGKDVMSLIPPEEQERLKKYFTSFTPGKPEGMIENFVVLSQTGERRWQAWTNRATFNVQRSIAEIQGVGRDITERKRVAAALQESEERYRSLVESTDDSIYIVDRACTYLFMNRKHQARLELLTYQDRRYDEFHTPEEARGFLERVEKVFETGEAHSYEHQGMRNGGVFLQTLSPIRSVAGTIVTVSVISKNITELKRLQDRLRVQSITDDLTGLYNRRGFFTLAEHQLKVSSRNKKGVYLLYADVDKLKEVNDVFGHLEGDQLIIETANILKDSFRDSDIIARIGGDEFVVFPVEDAPGGLETVMSRLRERVDRANALRTRKYALSFSLGKAFFDPKRPRDLEELLHEADQAMYGQKSQKLVNRQRSTGKRPKQGEAK